MPSEIRVDKVSSTTSPYDPVFSTTGGALSHRNMIINGAMQISQRGTTTAPTPKGANDDGYYTVDRYRLKCGGTTPSRFNLIQDSVTDLAGFSKALKVDCTTASASPGADDYVILAQRMEGFDLQQMEKGFSSAKPVTLSFYVKGTASRTYVVELRDTSSTARSASKQFTVTSSWVRHTITFPGDTGGEKIPNDNTFGLEVNFWLHAGANFTSGTYTETTFANHVDANTAVGISGSGAGAMQTTNDEVLFTGVQLELGSVATPFEHRSHGEELERCFRYYQRNVGVTKVFPLVNLSNTSLSSWISFYKKMRAKPSSVGIVGSAIGASGGSVADDKWAIYNNGAWKGCSSIAVVASDSSDFGMRLDCGANDSVSSGGCSGLYGGVSCGWYSEAEL